MTQQRLLHLVSHCLHSSPRNNRGAKWLQRSLSHIKSKQNFAGFNELAQIILSFTRFICPEESFQTLSINGKGAAFFKEQQHYSDQHLRGWNGSLSFLSLLCRLTGIKITTNVGQILNNAKNLRRIHLPSDAQDKQETTCRWVWSSR